RELRTRHRRAMLALALALPAAVAVALAARPAPPRPLPPPVLRGAGALERVLWHDEFGDATLRIRAALRFAHGRARARREHELAPPPRGPRPEIGAHSAIGHPAPLVYGAASEPIGTALPADAILLGPLWPSLPGRLALPDGGHAAGHLIVYDLPH